jgi:hypothetical protein
MIEAASTGAFANTMEDKRLRDFYVDGLKGLYHQITLLRSLGGDLTVLEIITDCVHELETQMCDYERMGPDGYAQFTWIAAEQELEQLKKDLGITGESPDGHE